MASVEGEGSGGAKVCTHSATSVTEEVCVAPPSEVYRRVGTQPAWRWGPVGSRLPSPGAKQWGGPTSTTRQRPRSGSLKTRSIKSMPSIVGEGRVDDGSGIGREGLTRQNEKRGGECARVRVMRSRRVDNIDSVTTIVGEGRAKVVGTVPVCIPRETVVGAVKGKTKLTGGVEGVGGEIVGKMVGADQAEREGSGRHGMSSA
jgi:hypothetical protein